MAMLKIKNYVHEETIIMFRYMLTVQISNFLKIPYTPIQYV